jgi:uncharacterized protein YeaO (DUF488 family)
MFRIKRVYDPPEAGDGMRVLVDRIWPRGVKKSEFAMDLWLKEVGPSTDLRKWFGHDPAKWEEFRRRYEAELDEKPELTTQLRQRAEEEPVTLLFSARDLEHNQAVALKTYLESEQ